MKLGYNVNSGSVLVFQEFENYAVTSNGLIPKKNITECDLQHPADRLTCYLECLLNSKIIDADIYNSSDVVKFSKLNGIPDVCDYDTFCKIPANTNYCLVIWDARRSNVIKTFVHESADALQFKVVDGLANTLIVCL